MAMLGRLRDDFRDFPATMGLGTLWILVFLMMVVNQASRPEGLTASGFVGGLHNGHPFGDLTLHELYAGQVWRALTATFVHYGLLHLGMNLLAMYQIGCLVESWYGAGPSLAIYVLTGGGGNLISALARRALHSDPLIHSGGGSTVVMGLAAICAVVGWRARTRLGDHMKRQMLWGLGLTTALGVGLSVSGLPVIDNWGHTGGALMGAAVGLANRGISRHAGGVLARAAGWLGVSLLAACAWAQVSDDRSEAVQRRQMAEQARRRRETDDRLMIRLDEVRQLYRVIATPRAVKRGDVVRDVPRRAKPTPTPAPPATANAPTLLRMDPEQELYLTVLNASLRSLTSMSADLDGGSNSADFRRSRLLLAQTLIEPPTLDELREFDGRMSAMIARVRLDRDRSLVPSVARARGVRLD